MAPVTRRRRHVTRGLLALAVAAVLAAGARPAAAQTVAEPALKAAFLVNFVKFTQWPAELLPPGKPVVLCVSDKAVADALAEIAAQTIDGRPLALRRVADGESWAGCTVAYVHNLDRRRASVWVTGVPAGVLTVSDTQDFTTYGGIIELVAVDGRMKFAVNVSEAERQQLRLSSKLLQLARIVRD